MLTQIKSWQPYGKEAVADEDKADIRELVVDGVVDGVVESVDEVTVLCVD